MQIKIVKILNIEKRKVPRGFEFFYYDYIGASSGNTLYEILSIFFVA